MKKFFLVAMTVLAVFMLASCASSKGVAGSADDEWWNNPPADTADYHFEVGYAEGSTVMTSRDWAKANANTALAQYVSNSIEAIVTTYVNDAGEASKEANNMQALQAFESLSKQTATAVLSGVTYKYHDTEKGCFVLAALPIGAFADELKANVTEAFQRNKAAETANNLMNAAIDKYFN